jgi:hypothetical protein
VQRLIGPRIEIQSLHLVSLLLSCGSVGSALPPFRQFPVAASGCQPRVGAVRGCYRGSPPIIFCHRERSDGPCVGQCSRE